MHIAAEHFAHWAISKIVFKDDLCKELCAANKHTDISPSSIISVDRPQRCNEEP